jgi:hypothetical protein
LFISSLDDLGRFPWAKLHIAQAHALVFTRVRAVREE